MKPARNIPKTHTVHLGNAKTEVHLLPFLKPKKAASVIIANRSRETGEQTESAPAGEHSPELVAATESFISALHAKDANAAATAFNAMTAATEVAEGDEA